MIDLLGTQEQGHEPNGSPSTAEIIAYDTPRENDSGLFINETPDDSEYDYPEVPRTYEYPDLSRYVYPNANAGRLTKGVIPPCTPTWNFDESLLEDNYTALKADRDNEDVNPYEPWRPENAENSESVNQEYVNMS